MSQTAPHGNRIYARQCMIIAASTHSSPIKRRTLLHRAQLVKSPVAQLLGNIYHAALRHLCIY